jgi:hypothetical protein
MIPPSFCFFQQVVTAVTDTGETTDLACFAMGSPCTTNDYLRRNTMNPYKETFKGRMIDISPDGNLTINAKQIDYEHDAYRNKWSTRYLPYTQFDSLVDLAKAVAGDTEEFTILPE